MSDGLFKDAYKEGQSFEQARAQPLVVALEKLSEETGNTIGVLESVVPDMNCRNDDDCDHCVLCEAIPDLHEKMRAANGTAKKYREEVTK